MQKTKNRIYLLILLLLVIAISIGGVILFTRGRSAGNNSNSSLGRRTESTVQSSVTNSPK